MLALVGSYLLGGFLGGAVAARLKGIDLSKRGSGSMGATNVLRTMGPLYAAGTLAIDVAKGAAAVALGRWAGYPGLDAVCGFLAIAGHNWPISAAFRGGKGIATTLGTMFLLVPKASLVLVPLWAVLALLTGFVSLGSMVAVAGLPLAVAAFYTGKPSFPQLITYAVMSAGMALYQHRENIRRLGSGTEHNLWRRKKKEPV